LTLDSGSIGYIVYPF